ncbi:MAG: FAD-binding oxidoreductase [Candidatus Korobacteraceae bacterium]
MNETRNHTNGAWTGLEAIVGREYVWPATQADVIDGMQPAGVIAPGNAQQVAEVLGYGTAAGLAIIPRGGGTKLWLGNRPRKVDFILSTERLNRVIEHAWGDMTVTVEAGCTIDHVQQALKEHGQRLAVDPLRPETATVGGLLATAESGTLRIRYGAVRDLVLGVEVALPDGSLIKAGGKVVKNVAGYDLTRLMTGSLGTLGVITRAVFRLHPIPVATATYSTLLTSAEEVTKVVLAILDSHVIYTGLQVRAQQAGQFTVDVRLDGIPESLQDQFANLSKTAPGCRFVEASGEVWTARQQLFTDAGHSVICKCVVLPDQIGSLCDVVFRHAQLEKIQAMLVVQATGVAELRLDGPGVQPLVEVVNVLRGELERLEGTLVVERCPVAVKEAVDVWGTRNDALPLMREIKGKFDPACTLNPGRFVGAI